MFVTRLSPCGDEALYAKNEANAYFPTPGVGRKSVNEITEVRILKLNLMSILYRESKVLNVPKNTSNSEAS